VNNMLKKTVINLLLKFLLKVLFARVESRILGFKTKEKYKSLYNKIYINFRIFFTKSVIVDYFISLLFGVKPF